MPAVAVQGLAELQRALKELEPKLAREFKQELKEAGQPVARTASALALRRIPNMTSPWSEFRIGTLTNIVYVAPKQRGTKSATKRRPNLAGLLLTRAMEPALSANEQQIVVRVEQAIGRVLKSAGF